MLPPETSVRQLPGEAPPVLAPDKRSAMPIVAAAITVLTVAGAGLAYAMLRGGGAEPASPAALEPAGSAQGTQSITPAAGSNSPAAPGPRHAPATTPDRATATSPPATPDKPEKREKQEANDRLETPARPAHKPAPGGRTGRTEAAPASPRDTSAGPVTRPEAADSTASDKPSGAVRDIRQVDPPRPPSPEPPKDPPPP